MKNQAIQTILQLAIIIFLATACNRTTQENMVDDLEFLAKSSTYIDVDPIYFIDSLYQNGQKQIPAEDLRKIKAVIHRIYSNVTIVDNAYELIVKTGAEIHISEHLFGKYKEDIAKNNKLIKAKNMALRHPINTTNQASLKSVEQGSDTIKIKPISKEYLNSLLK